MLDFTINFDQPIYDEGFFLLTMYMAWLIPTSALILDFINWYWKILPIKVSAVVLLSVLTLLAAYFNNLALHG